jgi:hypothetical protein
MPISRPLLIVLVAAVLALAGFYATQGSRDAVDSAPIVSTPPPSSPTADKSEPPTAVAKADESQAPAKQRDAGKTKVVPPAKTGRPAKAVAAVSGPAAVRRALDRKQRVVLFFQAPRGADDRATARAVAAQRGGRGVVVITEPIARLVRYRTLIGGLGISQAPVVVIVGKDGAARLVEGYVDPATLAQEVADAK